MLKKMICFMLTVTMGISLCACGAEQSNVSESSDALETANTSEISTQESTGTEESTAEVSEEAESGKVLIAYFTWSGNTEEMAEHIAEQTGGDILEIEPATPYPDDYNETGELAKVERDENQRPEIANLPESLDEYDTVLLGYPIWWHTAPMIIGTFLESYDLTDIDIYPFTQSASMNTEQFENSMDFVRQSAGNGIVHDGLFVDESDTEAIDDYLKSNGLIK